MRARRVARRTLFALAALGCGDPDRIASVGGDPAMFSEFETFVAERAGGEWASLEETVLARLLTRFLDEKLLERWVRDAGEVRRDELPLEAVARLVAEPVEVSEEDVRRHLAAHPELLARPARIELGQLLIPDRATAVEVRSLMVTGADFAPTAEAAGDLEGVVYGGYRELARADLPIAFRERLFEMEEGAISPVIEADYGFHVFHVARRHPAETLAWQAVAEEVRTSLRSQASKRIERDMLGRARQRYRVEVIAGNLPFSWDVEDRDEAGL